MSRTSAYSPSSEPMTCPRLAPSEVALLMVALEMRARVFLTSAALLGESNPEVARRDIASAERCRALADRLRRLHDCMKGNHG